MKTILTLLALLVLAMPTWAFDFRTGANSPHIVAPDGRYLGNLNSNRFDPDSVSNPYGRFGSKYSPDSINNPYGRYGNPFSPDYSGLRGSDDDE